MAIVFVERSACALSMTTESGDQIPSSACKSIGRENANIRPSIGTRGVTLLIGSIFFGFSETGAGDSSREGYDLLPASLLFIIEFVVNADREALRPVHIRAYSNSSTSAWLSMRQYRSRTRFSPTTSTLPSA